MGFRKGSVEKAGLLEVFSPSSKKDARRLASNTTVVDVAAGTVLCRQGEVPREVFVIVEGSVEVSRPSGPVAVLGVGEVFGELALLQEIPYRRADVVAETQSRLFVMSAREFAYLRDTVAPFRDWMKRVVKERS